MPLGQPTITTRDGKRRFACSPAAVLVFIINEDEEVLLLSHPKRKDYWEVVNGALEADETILHGALREAREEAGEHIKISPLGTVHVSTFRFDENVPWMISICYLMAYEGGEIEPGDDMRGSQYRWWSLAELKDARVKVIVPPDQEWLFERAVELYQLWRGRKVILQPDLESKAKNKYQI